jgi:hypothetical protein
MPARRQLWTPGGGGQHVEQLGVVARAGPVGVEEWRCSAPAGSCSDQGEELVPEGGLAWSGRRLERQQRWHYSRAASGSVGLLRHGAWGAEWQGAGQLRDNSGT